MPVCVRLVTGNSLLREAGPAPRGKPIATQRTRFPMSNTCDENVAGKKFTEGYRQGRPEPRESYVNVTTVPQTIEKQGF